MRSIVLLCAVVFLGCKTTQSTTISLPKSNHQATAQKPKEHQAITLCKRWVAVARGVVKNLNRCVAIPDCKKTLVHSTVPVSQSYVDGIGASATSIETECKKMPSEIDLGWIQMFVENKFGNANLISVASSAFFACRRVSHDPKAFRQMHVCHLFLPPWLRKKMLKNSYKKKPKKKP